MATFTHTPSYTSNADVENRILTANFGDGYSQVTEDGFNNTLRTYQLVFNNLTETIADQIMTFFSTNVTATTPFTWVTPDGFEGSFKCNERKKTFSNSLFNISCTFRETSFLNYATETYYLGASGTHYLADVTTILASDGTSYSLSDVIYTSDGSSYTIG